MHDETQTLPIYEHLQLHASQYKEKTQYISHPYTNIQITSFKNLPSESDSALDCFFHGFFLLKLVGTDTCNGRHVQLLNFHIYLNISILNMSVDHYLSFLDVHNVNSLSHIICLILLS